MLLLEPGNTIIRDTLTEKFARPAPLYQSFTDYDSTTYRLSTPGEKGTEHQILLSILIPCYPQLIPLGLPALITREYGQYVQQTAEPGFSLSLLFDVSDPSFPAEGSEERTALIERVAMLKRNLLAVGFEKAFAEQRELEKAAAEGQAVPETQYFGIQYRPEEAFYIKASADRVTVIFSTIFKEDMDRVFGRVFLQEFVDARRRQSIQRAPQVIYSNRDPPAEIRGYPGVSELIARGTGENEIGWVTFVLEPRHFSKPEIAYDTISSIQLFRDNLHYHIKCSKAYMHSRMRHRVAEFLKVLNRAKPENVEKERKTITGRTFVRG